MMEYLLDTHTFLWFLNGDSELSGKAKSCIENPEAIKYVSIASFWEIAVKVSIDKLHLGISFYELKEHAVKNDFLILPITFEHTAALTKLIFTIKIRLIDLSLLRLWSTNLS